MPKVYAFPGREGGTTANYLAVVGPGTAWPGSRKTHEKHVTDGPSNTIMLVENDGAGVHWMAPRDLSFADMDFTVGSPNGVSSPYVVPSVVTLRDEVRALGKGITPDLLRALLTARGGERVDDADGRWQLIEDGRKRPRREP